MSDPDETLPATLTLDEAFRAAFYLVLEYVGRGDSTGDVALLANYMWSDPARWTDWLKAVERAMTDNGIANPDHDGRWQSRPDMPRPSRDIRQR